MRMKNEHSTTVLANKSYIMLRMPDTQTICNSSRDIGVPTWRVDENSALRSAEQVCRQSMI